METQADNPRKLVVTVGGANTERVYSVGSSTFRLGGKHTGPPLELLPGGSAANYSCRLLAAGIDVWPVLPILEDDDGERIIEALRCAVVTGGFPPDHIDGTKLHMGRIARAETPFSTILVVGDTRTIFNEFTDELIRPFVGHCWQRLAPFGVRADGSVGDGTVQMPDAVMIGHIHGDRARRDHTDVHACNGILTHDLIKAFSAREVPVFANFGSSQYKLGAGFWWSNQDLGRLQCLQLAIDEAREFCRGLYRARVIDSLRLEDMLDWLKDYCSVVITMERMGALGLLKRAEVEDYVYAPPYELHPGEKKDPTGAGDAFAAGVVFSALDSKGEITTRDALQEALDTGCLWGAYAYTRQGGASNCPSVRDLEEFRRGRPRAQGQLRLFDRAFPD